MGHEPERTCAACRATAPKRDLIRLHRDREGTIHLDLAQHAPGRGAYLHRIRDCVEQARRRRTLERALKGKVEDGLWEAIPVA